MTMADFFAWCKQQGYDSRSLARALGLHYTSVDRVKRGAYKKRMGENFRARAIAVFGPEVKNFFADVPVGNDRHTNGESTR
jgi:hypothetical protein